MQELEIMHALKKENGIILVSQVQILILDSLKIWSFGTAGVKMDFFDTAGQFKSNSKLAFKLLKL